MKTKLLLFIAIMMITVSAMNGQFKEATSELKEFNHSIGFGAGFSTGYGISYRYMKNDLGIMANFAPFGGEDYLYMSAGVTFLYKLIDAKRTNFYLYQGNAFFYDKWTDWDNNEYKSSTWTNGIGAGMEIVILDRIGLNIMGGIAAYDSFNYVSLSGETGLYYKF